MNNQTLLTLNEPRITIHRGRALIEAFLDIEGVAELLNAIPALKALIKPKFEPWP